METGSNTQTNTQDTTAPQPIRYSRYRAMRSAADAAAISYPSLPESQVKGGISRYCTAPSADATTDASPPSLLIQPCREYLSERQERREDHSDEGNFDNGIAEDKLIIPKHTQALTTTPKNQQGPRQSAIRTQSSLVNKIQLPSRVLSGEARSQSREVVFAPSFENRAQQEAYAILTGETNRQKKQRDVRTMQDRSRVRIERAGELANKRVDTGPVMQTHIRHGEPAKRQARGGIVCPSQEWKQKTESQEKTQVSRQEPGERRQGNTGSAKHRESLTPPRNTGVLHQAYSNDDYSLCHSRMASMDAQTPPASLLGVVSPTHSNMQHQGSASCFDAPISAVNAGPRKVTVTFDELSTQVFVENDSTPVDIIHSAAALLSIKIDTQTSILAESYAQIGLERPLRHYERMRDVMNSWDHDGQNTILILAAEAAGETAALEADEAPIVQPGETSVNMYYSQKPGSWDKRWVTLRSDGQVFVSKQNGSELRSICHMSDFDIYNPTPRRSKKISSPKKYCLAIKSQQKPSMFLETTNFVHFFSTKDKELAAAWYKAVQSWRSWYLVHEMGRGKETQVPKQGIREGNAFVGSLPRQRGSFKPLVQEESFRTAAASGPVSSSSVPIRDDALALRKYENRAGPTLSSTNKLTRDPLVGSSTTNTGKPSIVQGPSLATSNDPFAAGSLLGRTYTQRHRALHSRQQATKDGMFPPSPFAVTMSTDTSRVLNMHSAKTMTQSEKPLIDVAPLPHNSPLPHHSPGPKSRGVLIDMVPSGSLIKMAMGRKSSGSYASGIAASRYEDSADTTESNPFTGAGLLAQLGSAKRPQQRHGPRSDGHTTAGPLVNLSQGSAYVQGSLLHGVETYMDGQDKGKSKGVIADREKRREVVERVGEGF